MNSILQKYPAYKDSGVEWLGEIPSSWEVKKLKTICKAFGRIGFRGYTIADLVNKGEGAITISPSNITDDEMHFGKCSYLNWEKYEQSPEIQIQNNDILIVKTGSTYGKIGLVKNLPEKATINPQLLVLKDIQSNTDYLFYLLKTSVIQTQIQQEVVGSTIPTISESKILNFHSILPPLPDQIAIAAFLDHKTALIEQAINIKQKQIELLKERRQILIHKAVTRGLNPDVKMKDSGVEWIGEIPEHWEVKKVKHFGKIKSGDSVVNSFLTESGIYEVFGGNGHMGYYNKFNVDGRKIIIGRVGAYCGNVRLINEKKWISDNALILILNDEEKYSYLTILLDAGNLNNLNSSNAQPLITGSKVLNFQLPIPTKSEQKEIIEFIENFVTKISAAIYITENEIEKLKEYKSSLINSAVTGKIKVN